MGDARGVFARAGGHEEDQLRRIGVMLSSVFSAIRNSASSKTGRLAQLVSAWC